MVDIAAFHVATRRNGQPDNLQFDDALSSVYHDQKTHYYNLTGMEVTEEEFKSFVANAWDIDPMEEIEVDEIKPGVFMVSL